MKEEVFNPWEIRGDINYGKLIKEFGVKPVSISALPKQFHESLLFRRGLVFAHRDFERIADCIKNKKKFVVMTGLMPTGRFHIGHMLVLQQIILFQKLGAKVYIAVADIEAYNSRGQSLEESRKIAIDQYLTNYIALGLKPASVDFYFQSERGKEKDAKKSDAYYRLASTLARYATFNEFKAVYGEITPGKMDSSLLQASDMFHAQLPQFEGRVPVVIPVGIDQDPHIRIARDMAAKHKEHKFIPISSTYNLFMPGLKSGKMSSSDQNSFIALTDTEKEVETKIKKYAFSGGRDTLEEHRKHGGNPDVDVSFQYLRMFFEPNDEKLKQIESDYRSGKLLTGELKQYLIEKINTFLKAHQKKMETAKKEVGKFLKMGKELK